MPYQEYYDKYSGLRGQELSSEMNATNEALERAKMELADIRAKKQSGASDISFADELMSIPRVITSPVSPEIRQKLEEAQGMLHQGGVLGAGVHYGRKAVDFGKQVLDYEINRRKQQVEPFGKLFFGQGAGNTPKTPLNEQAQAVNLSGSASGSSKGDGRLTSAKNGKVYIMKNGQILLSNQGAPAGSTENAPGEDVTWEGRKEGVGEGFGTSWNKAPGGGTVSFMGGNMGSEDPKEAAQARMNYLNYLSGSLDEGAGLGRYLAQEGAIARQTREIEDLRDPTAQINREVAEMAQIGKMLDSDPEGNYGAERPSPEELRSIAIQQLGDRANDERAVVSLMAEFQKEIDRENARKRQQAIYALKFNRVPTMQSLTGNQY